MLQAKTIGFQSIKQPMLLAVSLPMWSTVHWNQETNERSICFLTSEIREKSNSTAIAQLFTTKSLAIHWPEEVEHEDVLLVVTDAASYMKNVGRALKVLFLNMLHVTCLRSSWTP